MQGIPTGDVLIFAHWRLSTLTRYLTWFGKPPTSTGEAITLYRESTRFTIIEEEESSPLWQLSTSLYFSLLSAAMAATAGCLGSPLSPTFLTSLALHSHVCLYLQASMAAPLALLSTMVATNSSSSSTIVAANL